VKTRKYLELRLVAVGEELESTQESFIVEETVT
jgi:hypothetical protein